jgi:hypothetical protein
MYGHLAAAAARGLSISKAGKDFEIVIVRSGGIAAVCSARVITLTASPAVGGTYTVAVRDPLLTQACPVSGSPSHPRNGIAILREVFDLAKREHWWEA